MTLTDLAGRIGITPVNLKVLKNNRAKAVRFSTLDAICRELGCQPADSSPIFLTNLCRVEGGWMACPPR